MSKNKIALTKAMLDQAGTTQAILELDAVKNQWVGTYNKVSGSKDGELRFEAEKILFLQTIAASDKLKDCDPFSRYASFIELAISGLTLRDGLSYIIPYGKKAQFQVGWKGRLEQINEMPAVVHCHEPQVVYDCDEFDYEKGERIRIKKHVPKEDRPADAKVMHVYFVIEFKHGPEVYMMDRTAVIHIRDKYSPSFKSYMKALTSKVNVDAGKKFGDKLMISYKDGSGNWKTFESDEIPMWVDDETQAFKKTIVKRVYNTLPKLPKHKHLDEKEAIAKRENNLAEETDTEELKPSDFTEFTDLPEADQKTAAVAPVAPSLSSTASSLEEQIGNPQESF